MDCARPDGEISIPNADWSSRRLAYAALMTAAGLAGLYAEPIPNLELLTLVAFCSGVLLGSRDGAMVGGLTEFLYSLFNPYGIAHPLVTVSQVVGMALPGVLGGWAMRLRIPSRGTAGRLAFLIPAGILLTVFFDLITNVASGLVYGQMKVTLLGGIPFALIHVGTNALLFGLIGLPLIPVFARYRSRLSS